jgi:formyltetrahydrofolate deformylase
MKNTAVLLLSTPMALARKGVVAEISQFLIGHNGSVLHSDDHLDSGRDLFLSRLEWDLDGFDIPVSDFLQRYCSRLPGSEQLSRLLGRPYLRPACFLH